MKRTNDTTAELARIMREADPAGPKRRRRYAEPDPFDRFTAWGGGDGARTGPDRRHSAEAVLGQVVAAGGSAGGTVRFRVVNPSPRLRVKVAVSFFPAAPVDAAPSISSSTVDLVPWIADAAGSEGPADAIVSGEQLPYGYEAETAADTFRGTVTLAQQTSLPGFFKVICTWEPPEDMSDERWTALRARASLSRIDRDALSIAAGGSP